MSLGIAAELHGTLCVVTVDRHNLLRLCSCSHVQTCTITHHCCRVTFVVMRHRHRHKGEDGTATEGEDPELVSSSSHRHKKSKKKHHKHHKHRSKRNDDGGSSGQGSDGDRKAVGAGQGSEKPGEVQPDEAMPAGGMEPEQAASTGNAWKV